MLKLHCFKDTKALFPSLLSLWLVFVSQMVRHYFDYSIYPALFLVPFYVYVFLIIVSNISNTDKSNYRGNVYKGLKPLIWRFFYVFFYGAIGIRFVGIVWGSGYLSPVFEAQYIAGKANIDTLFHAAISNMLMEFGKSSIGVEGVVSIPYHFLSHLIIGFTGRILGFGAWESYHLIYPTLFLPVFLGLFLILVEGLRSYLLPSVSKPVLELLALASFFFTIAGIIPDPVRKSIASWNNSIVSESYATALIFMYFFIILLLRSNTINKKRIRLISCNILVGVATIVLTLSKISVGTLWVVGFFFFMLEKPKNLNRLLLLFSAGLGWLIVIPMVKNTSGSGSIELLHFLRTYVDLTYWGWFPVIHFGLTFIALGLIKYLTHVEQIGITTGRNFKFILAGVSVTSALPGLLLSIAGGSAIYFSNVNSWISLPIVTVLGSAILLKIKEWKKSIHSYKYLKYLILMLIFAATITAGFNTIKTAIIFKKNSSKYVHRINDNSKQLWEKLHYIQEDVSHDSVIFYNKIPSYGDLYEGSKRSLISIFLSSAALIGIPTLNEIEPYFNNKVKTPYGYGFDSLSTIEHDFSVMNYQIITVY